MGSSTVRVVLAIGLGCLVGACGRSPQSVSVEVFSEPAAVAAARKAAALRREELLADLLQRPSSIRSYDAEALELIRENRERAHEALQRTRLDPARSPADRLDAMLALRFVDEPVPATELVVQARASSEAGLALLGALHELYPKDTALPVELVDWLVGLVDAQEERLRRTATHLVGWRRVPTAAHPVAARLAREGDAAEDFLLEAAARLAPSHALLARLRGRLEPAKLLGGSTGLGAVVALCESAGEVALRRAAVDVMRDYLCAQNDQRWIDGVAMSAIAAIRTCLGADDAARELAALVRSAKWGAVRRQALDELARLDSAAAAALAAEVGLPLDVAAGRSGGSEIPDVRACAAACVTGGLMSQAEADSALALLAEHTDTAQSAGGIRFLAAAERVVGFDTETGEVPARHDRLVLEFARASRGRFRPEAVLESYRLSPGAEDGSSYSLQFVHDGRLYRSTPSDLGDWYDVAAVTALIERALKDAGCGERFVQCETGDQSALFVFGKPDVVRAVAGRLGLVLTDDPEGPRRAGRDFEEKVLRDLGE